MTTVQPPSYATTSILSLPVPPYAPANVAAYPTKRPCHLTLRNMDKLESDIPITNPDDHHKLVFLVSHAPVAPHETALKQVEQDGYTLAARLIVSLDATIPYVIRKHKPTGTYDFVSLVPPCPATPSASTAAPASQIGEVLKLTTKTTLFKTKYHFPGPDSRDLAWKGNVSRILSLYDYPAASSATKEKTLLSEFHRTSTAASLSLLDADLGTACLVIASLLPLVVAHRHHLATHFTTEADLARLQREVRPSTWDATFLSAGKGTIKQEQFKAQMERERERDKKERSQSRHRNEIQGVIPALPDRRSLSRNRAWDSKEASSDGEETPEDEAEPTRGRR
ncbi:hypothetical protein ACQY0O_007630 [Thecaphora frezii]